jgi:phosphoserine aminotransferase
MLKNHMLYFTAGPSQVFPSLPKYMEQAVADGILSISHRGQQFMDIYARMENGLRKVLDVPAYYHVFLFSSATEIWERIAQNCIAKESFHLVNGSFSQSFAETVRLSGKKAVEHKVEDFTGVEVNGLEIPDAAELIATIANESSTGVMMPPEDLYALRERYPEKLIVVDAVSAVPTWRVDISRIDGLYFSVQKGFGLPAGLGVLVLSPRMLERGLELEKQGQMVGSYHRWSSLLGKSKVHQTPATPNVLAIYLLGEVCREMIGQMDWLLHNHAEKYRYLAAHVTQHPDLDFAVRDARVRSNTVITLETKWPDVKAKLADLEGKGFVLGTGYGKFADRQIRISNFPATNLADMRYLLQNL